jgi:hypothetical protein
LLQLRRGGGVFYSKNRLLGALTLFTFVCLVGLFRIRTDNLIALQKSDVVTVIALVAAVLVILYLSKFAKFHPIIPVVLVALSVRSGMVAKPFFNDVNDDGIKGNVLPTTEQNRRYLQDVGNGFIFEVDGSRMSFARQLLIDAPLFNGYDPNGQVEYNHNLPGTFGRLRQRHADYLFTTFDEKRTIDNKKVCKISVLGITGLNIAQSSLESFSGVEQKLAACGFDLSDTIYNYDDYAGSTMLFYTNNTTLSKDFNIKTGTATYAEDGLTFSNNKLLKETREEVNVQNTSSTDKMLYFGRMFWKGYTATLDGKPLEIDPRDGFQVAVKVPANSSGLLELQYNPVSYKYVVPLSLLALFASICFPIAIALMRRRNSRKESVLAKLQN